MTSPLKLAEIHRIATELDAICGDDAECFADMIEGSTDLYYLVGKLHERIAERGELLTGIDARQDAIAIRKKRLVAGNEADKAAIGRLLRAAKLPKVELPEATYSVRDGRPTLTILDPTAVPEEYQKVSVSPDKTRINQTFADVDALPNWLSRHEARDIVSMRTK